MYSLLKNNKRYSRIDIQLFRNHLTHLTYVNHSRMKEVKLYVLRFYLGDWVFVIKPYINNSCSHNR